MTMNYTVKLNSNDVNHSGFIQMLISRFVLFYLVVLIVTPTFAMMKAPKPTSRHSTPPTQLEKQVHQPNAVLIGVLNILIDNRDDQSGFKFQLNKHMPSIESHEVKITLRGALSAKLNLYAEMANLKTVANGYETSAQKRLEVIEFLRKICTL